MNSFNYSCGPSTNYQPQHCSQAQFDVPFWHNHFYNLYSNVAKALSSQLQPQEWKHHSPLPFKNKGCSSINKRNNAEIARQNIPIEVIEIVDEYKEVKATQHSSNQENNKMVRSFADLVYKTTNFWMNKLTENTPRSPLSLKSEELANTEKHEKNSNFFMAEPSLMTAASLERESEISVQANKSNRSLEFANKKWTFIKETDRFNKDNLQRISKKQIKKVPKSEKGNWGRKHDARLLSLVEELGKDWDEITRAFSESFVSPKYLKERYQALCSKKSGLKPQKSAENENSNLMDSLGPFGDDCETKTVQFDEAINCFYTQMKEDTQELRNQYGEEQIISVNSKEEESSESCIEIGLEEFQAEEIIDSYSNSNKFDELEQTLLKNKHCLAKTNLCKSPGEAKEIITLVPSPVRVEEDIIGEEKSWKENPKEAIEILKGRISLIKSLYNQTQIELEKLQSDRKE